MSIRGPLFARSGSRALLRVALGLALIVVLALLPGLHGLDHSDHSDHGDSEEGSCVVCHLIGGGMEPPAAVGQFLQPASVKLPAPPVAVSLHTLPFQILGDPRGPPPSAPKSV